MEYRRRRTGTRYAGRDAGGGGGAALRAIILLAVFGALIYMIVGTGLGKKLRDKYAVSLYDKLTGNVSATALPSVKPTALPTAQPTPAPTGESCDVSLPAIDVYMLQMGFFDSVEEAAPKAASLRELGAAGYIYDDEGSLRLIAAAYSDEASARSVKSRLEEEGYVCSIFRLSRKGVDLMITASPERLLPVRTAFALASDVIAQLDELSIDFDANARSVEYGLGVISEIRDNLRAASNGIEDAARLNGMLSLVNVYLNDIRELAADVLGQKDRTDFASALKTLRVKAALRYAELLKAIGE